MEWRITIHKRKTKWRPTCQCSSPSLGSLLTISKTHDFKAWERSGYCSLLLQMNSKLQCLDPRRPPAIGRLQDTTVTGLQKNPSKNENQTRGPQFYATKDQTEIRTKVKDLSEKTSPNLHDLLSPAIHNRRLRRPPIPARSGDFRRRAVPCHGRCAGRLHLLLCSTRPSPPVAAVRNPSLG